MRYSLLFVYQALFVDMSECLIVICQVLSESLHKTHGHKHRFFVRRFVSFYDKKSHVTEM